MQQRRLSHLFLVMCWESQMKIILFFVMDFSTRCRSQAPQLQICHCAKISGYRVVQSCRRPNFHILGLLLTQDLLFNVQVTCALAQGTTSFCVIWLGLSLCLQCYCEPWHHITVSEKMMPGVHCTGWICVTRGNCGLLNTGTFSTETVHYFPNYFDPNWCQKCELTDINVW